MAQQLLPCPFCGSTKVEAVAHNVGFFGKCYNCGAQTRPIDWAQGHYNDDRSYEHRDFDAQKERGLELAARDWNRRPETEIWTKWQLKSTGSDTVPIMKLRYAITEPGDEHDWIPSGRFEQKPFEIWVRYKTATNEPEYKKIFLPK